MVPTQIKIQFEKRRLLEHNRAQSRKSLNKNFV